EFLVQTQLLGQRMAQGDVIIDQEYLATDRHFALSTSRAQKRRCWKIMRAIRRRRVLSRAASLGAASYHALSPLATRRHPDDYPENGGKQGAEPLAEPVDDRKMVLRRLVDDRELAAPPAPFGGEFRLLPVELRGLPATDRENERMVRRRRRRQQPARAVAPRRGGVQAENRVEIAEADRLGVEDAADRAAAADGIAVEAEARPVGEHRHRRQMTAGGVTGEKKAAAAEAEALAVAGEKGDR